MTGWVIVLVGAVLCFAGAASVHLAVLLSGFGLAWLLADVFNLSLGTTVIFALVAALIFWVLASLVFRLALFFVGAVVGAVIGARVYSMLESQGSVVVGLVFVGAVAFVAGWIANRWRLRALLVLTALGGAGLLLNGLGRVFSSADSSLSSPQSGAQSALAAIIWLAVAALGWLSQRKVSARALGTTDPSAR
jgi:hypothetical protein